jgi:hypothetical protein
LISARAARFDLRGHDRTHMIILPLEEVASSRGDVRRLN